MKSHFAVVLMLLLAATGASAAPCAQEDFETRVSGASECLIMQRYGATEPATMIVWLHGNVSTGGPANSHFKIAAKAAADLAAENVLTVALVRPGYPDGTGAYSSGSDNGRADNWQKATIAEIGTAIERLRARYKPRLVVVVGHSGGAAIAAVLMGMRPDLAQAALLLACPCDMVSWRAGKHARPWASEDPLRWIERVDASARVVALTGSRDDTTGPDLARTYIAKLQARGVDASFELVPDVGHIDLLRSPALAEATARLVRR
jgi:pimeloyl-ACP methyl ester carboxylesterase